MAANLQARPRLSPALRTPANGPPICAVGARAAPEPPNPAPCRPVEMLALLVPCPLESLSASCPQRSPAGAVPRTRASSRRGRGRGAPPPTRAPRPCLPSVPMCVAGTLSVHRVGIPTQTPPLDRHPPPGNGHARCVRAQASASRSTRSRLYPARPPAAAAQRPPQPPTRSRAFPWSLRCCDTEPLARHLACRPIRIASPPPGAARTPPARMRAQPRAARCQAPRSCPVAAVSPPWRRQDHPWAPLLPGRRGLACLAQRQPHTG